MSSVRRIGVREIDTRATPVKRDRNINKYQQGGGEEARIQRRAGSARSTERMHRLRLHDW
jgi:hypothetical protein